MIDTYTLHSVVARKELFSIFEMYLVNIRVPGGIRNLWQCKLSSAAQAAVMDAPKKHAPRQRGFESLGLGEDLLAAIAEHRLETPTEIQVICSRTQGLMQIFYPSFA